MYLFKMFLMIYSDLSEDLPELDVTSSIGGLIKMVLSTEFNCAGDACLNTSELLFNEPYPLSGGLSAENMAQPIALAKCIAGNGFEIATILCF